MTHVENSTVRWAITLALLLLVVAGGIDLVLDRPQRWFSAHVLLELAMIAGALVLVLALRFGWRRAARSAATLRKSAEMAQQEREVARARLQRALEGLGAAMDEQFEAWQLTPAEREVALLLLQGHSHKRIAVLTDRSERTVRQHATAAYQKAGLHGRAELAGFFLGDLMLPGREAEATRTGP